MRVRLKIAELARRRGMTQADIARKLNYSEGAVSYWNSGRQEPNLLTLTKLMLLLNCRFEDIVDIT